MNESALKERLKSIAKEKGIAFNEIWKQFLLERFLARLSRSAHQEKFIFKGGLLLTKYIKIGRETTDADFLIQNLKSEEAYIKSAIADIIAVTMQDQFQFEWDDIEELKQPHMIYPGFRIWLKAFFGKMKDKIQIDIGVGDLVIPNEENIDPFRYKGKPIFDDDITLLVYPIETIFAEKLETVIAKGANNSRMKDYHDLLLLTRKNNLARNFQLLPTIQTTFEHRETILQLPINFDEAGIRTLQSLWKNHLNSLGQFKDKLNLPEEIAIVIAEINNFLGII